MLSCKRRAGAYFSIEAAILVPFTFFLFVLVIHLSFFFYGRALMAQDVYLVSLRAGLLRDGEDRLTFMQDNSMWQFGDKYMGNVRPQPDCRVERDKVSVNAESTSNRSGFDFGGSESWTYHASAEAMDLNIPLRLRRAKRFADLGQEILGMLNGD